MNKKLTIASFFIASGVRTGGQKRFLELLSGLRSKGHHIILIHNIEAKLPDLSFDLYPTAIFKSKLGSDKGLLRSIKKGNIVDKLTESGVDIILQFGDSTRSCVKFLKKKLSIPAVIAIRHNYLVANKIIGKYQLDHKLGKGYTLKRKIRDKIVQKQTISAADHIVFQTDSDLNGFISNLYRSRIGASVIPNNINVSWMDQESKNICKSLNLKRILSLGNMNFRKGLVPMIEGFSLAVKNDPDLKLSFIGDYSDKKTEIEITQLIKKLNLSKSIEFLGRIDKPLTRFNEWDLLIVPSLYDAFPNTVLEALHTGMVVIGSDVAGIKFMLQEPQLLFTPGDKNSIAQKIVSLSEKDNWEKAKKICINRAKEFDFDWVGKFEKVLESFFIGD